MACSCSFFEEEISNEISFNLCFGFFLRSSRPLAVRLYSFGARKAHLHLFFLAPLKRCFSDSRATGKTDDYILKTGASHVVACSCFFVSFGAFFSFYSSISGRSCEECGTVSQAFLRERKAAH